MQPDTITKQTPPWVFDPLFLPLPRERLLSLLPRYVLILPDCFNGVVGKLVDPKGGEDEVDQSVPLTLLAPQFLAEVSELACRVDTEAHHICIH